MARESAPDDAGDERIAELAARLGRPVCGVRLEDGEPCPAAPGPSGVCAAHADVLTRTPRTSGAAAGRTLLWVSASLIVALVVVGLFVQFRQDPAEAIWRQAAALVATGRTAEAEGLYEVILREHPESRFAPQAARLLGRSLPSPSAPSAPAHRSPADRLFQEARNFYPLGGSTPSDLEEATRRYLAVADSWPQDPLAREALFHAAQCLDHLGRTDEAVATWERLLERYPEDGRCAEALYALGFILETQRGDREGARARFAELERRFPESSAAAAARALTVTGSTPRAGEPAATAPAGPAPSSGRPTVRTEPGRL